MQKVALSRIFYRNKFEIVSVVISCTYFRELDSFACDSKDKVWGRLGMRNSEEGKRKRNNEHFVEEEITKVLF